MKFRNDIGALRALAVLAVLFFHFKVPYFNGGFSGVDVFFVISGYLMTRIILNGFENENFSFKHFYSKRITRIIPALLFLLVGLMLIGNFILLPSDLQQLGNNAFFSALFVSNIDYYLHSGYFDASSQNNILLHTWSLSVEWQFYLLFPLLLYPFKAIYSKNKMLFTSIFIGLIIFSFGLNQYINTKDLSFSFYMFPTRAWEMLIGGLAFLQEGLLRKGIYNGFKKVIAVIGYGTLLACIYLLDEENISWPSYYTLIPVLATFFIIITQSDFKILAFKPIQYIGKLSYSLYLWHWPIYVLAIYLGFNQPNATFFIFSLSFCCACVSYYLIESNKRFDRVRLTIFSTLAVVVLAIIVMIFPYDRLKINEEIEHLTNYNSIYRKEHLPTQFRKGSCHLDVDNTFQQYDFASCATISPNKKNILLLGDSHAGVFGQSLKEQLSKLDINLLQATVSTSYPLLETKGPKVSCELIDYMYQAFIPKHAKDIDEVILVGFWGSQQYPDETLKIKLQQVIQYFKSKNIPLKMIGQTPTYSIIFPNILALQLKHSKLNESNYLEYRSAHINQYLKTFIPADIYIDIYDLPEVIKYNGKDPYMHDDDHLSKYGADQVISYLLRNKLI
ncbi:acyltransferase [Sphingobacterium sp. SRCM116780]|uniref:acyltransferase family protein n=1 Tax=Sphingobacterium sp. SRCM116780 TaxID=2907623 RepID=UPI001F32AF0E|nr:acyltransferase family protein [Sphingobacterium sp. SRCM116780]UIR54712.1 acyltransferase [Sphingobacterium sp. SRCM116780]